MNTIKALIVDDETNSRIVLKNLLKEFYPQVNIIGEAADANDAYKEALEKKPDVVFLDVQMPGGSGFTFLKKFIEVPFEVIFVTSFDNYAIDAIKFNALDYVLKPIEITDLKRAVEKAIKRKLKHERSVQIINLINTIESRSGPEKIVVHVKDNVKLLNVSQIMYIEADDSYCNITMISGDKYTTAKFLKDFEDFLKDNTSFVRIHKSCMVNILHIKHYTKREPCMITMEDGKVFEVARRKKQEILAKLKK